MKKFTAILLCLLLALSLAACGTSSSGEDETASVTEATAGMANPLTEYDSLEEVNEITGGKLTHPGVMGVVDKLYQTVDCGEYTIGEYRFEVNGVEYTMRFSSNYDEDISGIYDGEGTAFEGSLPEADEIVFKSGSEYRAACWKDINGQYVLSIGDANVAEDIFKGIAEELCDLTNPAMNDSELAGYYAGMEGEYQDSVSQKATATVTASGSNGAVIKVSWANSAFEATEWTMTAKLYEDGLLSYDDCTCIKTTYADDGTPSEEVEYTGGEGFFTPQDDGSLLWNGAADEQCASCVFEKVIPA